MARSPPLQGLFFRERGYFRMWLNFMNPRAPAAQRRFFATHERLCVIFRRMTRSECLKRSAECSRLAEAASEPEMKVYLLRLALCWMQAATSADERVLEEA